ncbi:hypothetical protein J437_LFUL016067 [Ladona fulva]|uniref:Sulfotransferase domain-containing protein n=1 Tax=Ladona fulva TaxID=123851 RepID=A0A8K0P7S0_LADFU|nr:hypothetical protein J437_LFUL016067 [Ladona fulva]
MGSVVTPPLPNNYEKLGAYEGGRQIVKHKSSDKKANWNFLLPSSSSTKRSKLTLLIFCLAITSLLISLHALSTDSSLYIKPTFFLVQEDDAPTSSENPYIEAPHYFSQIEWERFSGDVSKSSQLKSFQEITDDNEKMKAQNQMGNGNELNAAYGIDGGTTGADVNIEDYTGDEDIGVLATSGNRVKFPKATRRLPQALIIGVRKGGTRALLEMLHLHPLIQKAAGEAHFFDRDENYAKGLQWYRRRMPPSLKGQKAHLENRVDEITVEKSPSYFVTPEVPERVRAMNASIRLLLIVREPVTRAISDFAQLRSHSLAAKANATSRTKLDGGAEEDYGKKPIILPMCGNPTRSLSSFESLAILPDGRVDMSWRPISVSLYHRHIAAWLEAFPRDQILIVDGDQLASNPAPVLASVEKFLKLRPALTPTHFYFNATKGFYCLRSLPPGQQVDGMAMLPSSMNHPSSLPEGKCLRESKGRRHPRVDPSVVHKLRRFFAEHNRRFYEMVGEDFGWPEE